MADITLQTIQKELVHIRSDLEFLKHVVKEDYELSEWAKKELAEARRVPDSELISHEKAKKLILGR